MHAIIRIDMDNAAFQPYPEGELFQIVSKLARRIENSMLVPGDVFALMDSNGNRVGQCEIKDGKDPVEWC